MNGWNDGWIDGWMDGMMDGWPSSMDTLFISLHTILKASFFFHKLIPKTFKWPPLY